MKFGEKITNAMDVIVGDGKIFRREKTQIFGKQSFTMKLVKGSQRNFKKACTVFC